MIRILDGDCRDVLKTLPDESVHCVVTSPPYWGLRDYGTEPQVWGGDPDCAHDWDGFVRAGMSGGPSDKQDSNAGSKVKQQQQQQQQCKKCAAWMGNFGLEPTPQMYVEHTVQIFREARRVLRDDGTLWLNLGDSYTGSGKGGNPEEGKQATNKGSQTIGVLYGKTAETAREAALTNVSRRWTTEAGMAPKNLVGIPWRVAFALQADGWYLRQDIIWAKPNPMPESVIDRCTKAHEYIFMLSKRARYYYDQDAIKIPATLSTVERLSQPGLEDQEGSYRVPGKTNGPMKAVGKVDRQRGHSRRHAGFNDRWDAMEKAEQCSGMVNKRSVWTVATQPFSEAHFATFPPKLIEPCILAGCPTGGTVLDPFGGAGTTGLVADRLQRDAILIELNQEYAAMARRRISGDAPLFAEVA